MWWILSTCANRRSAFAYLTSPVFYGYICIALMKGIPLTALDAVSPTEKPTLCFRQIPGYCDILSSKIMDELINSNTGGFTDPKAFHLSNWNSEKLLFYCSWSVTLEQFGTMSSHLKSYFGIMLWESPSTAFPPHPHESENSVKVITKNTKNNNKRFLHEKFNKIYFVNTIKN